MRVSVTVSIDAENLDAQASVNMSQELVSATSLETVTCGMASEAAVRAVRAVNLPPSENPGLKGEVGL